MNYEQEILRSIDCTTEQAKEKQPIRADVYLAHIDYYQKKLEQNRCMTEEFIAIKNEIDILKKYCLEVLLQICSKRDHK